MSPSPASNARFSLRQVLTIPFVLLILLLAFTIAAISFRAGYNAVETMAQRLLIDISARISQAMDSPLTRSRVMLDAAAPESVITPQLSPMDAQALITRLWAATLVVGGTDAYVYYGNEAALFYGIKRARDRLPELRQKTKPDEPRSTLTLTSLSQPPQLKETEKTLYDPRTRPWYKQAVAKKAPLWAEVYASFSTKELLITRAKPVYRADGALEGVYATDVSLRAMSDFLQALTITKNGVAFIVENNGDLIAQSIDSPPYKIVDGKPARLNAADSNNELIRTAYAAFKDGIKLGKKQQSNKADDIQLSNGKAFAAIDTLKDDDGLGWYTIVAVPSDDVLGDVRRSVTQVIVIALACAVLALLLGMGILTWVTRDLSRLTEAVRRVRDGLPYKELNMARSDEIGELANNFESMQKSLHTDRLTGLYNREAFFKELNFKIKGAKDAGLTPHLAVLFGDLTKFKAVNDTLGHQVGDAVLIEYGKRLQEAVRVGDTVARYAGDEYVILLEGVDTHEQAQIVIDKINLHMEPTFESLKGSGLNGERMSGSLGVAIYPEDGETAEALVKAADAQMYDRKFAANDGKSSR
jgi:diguanylate cyclase (GGDEF)-like protein